MKNLKERVEKFNQNIDETYYHLNFLEPVNDSELKELIELTGIELPNDLLDLYKQVGSIQNDADERYSIEIDSVPYLLEALKEENKWYRCHSLGLIDYIKFSWVNDRPEFDQFSKKSDIDYLNENYKCFGLYRDWEGLEQAYYIYFDKNGKFGTVRYHQDDYDGLWDEHLNEMLIKSPANKSLEELLIEIIDKLETEILEKDTD